MRERERVCVWEIWETWGMVIQVDCEFCDPLLVLVLYYYYYVDDWYLRYTTGDSTLKVNVKQRENKWNRSTKAGNEEYYIYLTKKKRSTILKRVNMIWTVWGKTKKVLFFFFFFFSYSFPFSVYLILHFSIFSFVKQ